MSKTQGTIGDRVFELRNAKGWDRKTLDEKIGMGHGLVKKLEEKTKPITLALLEKLAEVFEVEMGFFFSGKVAVLPVRLDGREPKLAPVVPLTSPRKNVYAEASGWVTVPPEAGNVWFVSHVDGNWLGEDVKSGAYHMFGFPQGIESGQHAIWRKNDGEDQVFAKLAKVTVEDGEATMTLKTKDGERIDMTVGKETHTPLAIWLGELGA